MPDSGVCGYARDCGKIQKPAAGNAIWLAKTRPTSDRLRETLFNVVAPLVADSVWLDLFAGSGAVRY